ncbi:MAG: recombinase family protein [Candidatus Wallbacteria bacterium]|nr:recombinase family protein [Candidatus Wallbacteria bacterium]
MNGTTIDTKRAVILVRVSTKNQAEYGFSLEDQEAKCLGYANLNGYKVVRVFRGEGESATVIGAELETLLKFVTDKRNKINAVIIWAYDRLARSMADHTHVIELLTALHIKILAVSQPLDESPMGNFCRTVIQGLSQLELEVKNERTTSGMMMAVKQGYFCWKAPFGFDNMRDALGKPILIQNSKAVIVSKIFSDFLNGMTIGMIAVELQRTGEKISERRVRKILKHPIYAGRIVCKWNKPQGVKGLHTPLISEELFNSVQTRFVRNKKTRESKKKRLYLNGFLICGKCGHKLRSYTVKNIIYCDCKNKNCNERIEKMNMFKQLTQILSQLTFNPADKTLLMQLVERREKSRMAEEAKELERLDKELSKADELRRKVITKHEEGVYTDQVYKERSQHYEAKIKELQTKIQEQECIMRVNCSTYIKFVEDSLKNICSLWKKIRESGKTKIVISLVRSIFPEGIQLLNRKVYCPTSIFGRTEAAVRNS